MYLCANPTGSSTSHPCSSCTHLEKTKITVSSLEAVECGLLQCISESQSCRKHISPRRNSANPITGLWCWIWYEWFQLSWPWADLRAEGATLFVPIGMMFMWDVFVGELDVVCGFFLKHHVIGKLNRHRNMDLEQLKWPQKRESSWWLLPLSFMLFVSLASSTSDYFLSSFSPLWFYSSNNAKMTFCSSPILFFLLCHLSTELQQL